MNNFKDVFYKFYNKINKLMLPLLVVAFLLNIGSQNKLGILSNIVFLFVFIVNFIYFIMEKRKSEAIIFGVLLVIYTIVMIIF